MADQYSMNRDAVYKRLRYATMPEVRATQSQRVKEWRKRQKALNPVWARYESVRVQINSKRYAIIRTEAVLARQHQRMEDLHREYVKLKRRLERKSG